MAGLAPLAGAQPAADAVAVRWQCSAAGQGTVALLPGERLGGIVDRYAGLYATRVVGLVQSGERVYLLGTGGFESRVGTRADVASASPAEHEFVARRHDFQAAGQGNAAGYLCLEEAAAYRQGLVRTDRGEIVLEAGRSVALFDPADPAVTVELNASRDSPMKLAAVAASGGRLGIYAGLMRDRGQVNANIALQAPGGEIVFRAAPDPMRVGDAELASGGRVGLSVSDAAMRKAPPAAAAPAPAPAQPPAQPAVIESPVAAASPSVAVEPPAPVVETASSARGESPTVLGGAPVAPRSAEASAAGTAVATVLVAQPRTAATEQPQDDGGYERAMRQLAARQGTGVRSISELTRVHPAVDVLRSILR